jgi:hypothetical protein
MFPSRSAWFAIDENPHLAPTFPKGADTGRLDILDLQELVLAPKGEEVGEERVEVRLGPEVEQLREVGVVDVRKDT